MTATPFRLDDPLPTGTLVLEASAGTGKTYAIAALAVRFIAEGTPVSRLLMATFSNAASTELRDRTRTRLRECADALVDLDAAAASGDALVALLAAGSSDEAALRRERLLSALSDFDAATMATTHTFCNRMLTVLGFLGERDQHHTLVEDVDDLAREAGRDLYLKRFAGQPDDDYPFPTATEIARDALRNPTTALAPTGPDAGAGATWVRFAAAVRDRVDTRKRWSRLRTYDDLQGRLHAIITDPEAGGAACARIRGRYDVVLVDEFQDTDPEQWEILRRCFHGHRPMVLVGDPKQSIYAFRGAEVLSYLAAAREAQDQRNLTVNWRSDGPLVDALGAVLVDAELGDRQIAVHPVRAAQADSRIVGAPPLRVRFFDRRDFTKHTKDGSTPLVPGVRERVIADVADDIAATLASGARIVVDGRDGPRERPVEPGDIAVLLRTNSTIEPLQRALGAYGIATVVTGGQSVFATDAARYWWYLLSALDRPSDARRVRLAAVTPLVGVTPAELDAAGDAGVGALAADLATWARVFESGGPAAMTAQILADRGVAGRVLGLVDGERLLTDLLQVASLLGDEVAENGSGLTGLAAWLGENVADRGRVQRRANQTRRLDRDTAAVQLMTVHASKGLEFPIVYVPFGWDGVRPSRPTTFTFHDDAGVRHLDVGGMSAPGYHQRKARADAEAAGEELRLLYVALTRARSQVVAWWAPSTTTPGGAFHRVLFTADERTTAMRAGGHHPIPETVPLTDDAGEALVLQEVAGLHEGIVVEHAGKHTGVPRWHPPAPDAGPADLAVARFDRVIDETYRRTSYSAIVRAAHEAAHAARGAVSGVTSEPDDAVVRDGEVADEPPEADEPETADTGGEQTGTPSLMNGLPFGARFGTLVHEVLEHVDTGADDRSAHVRELCVEGARRSAFEIDVDRLATALEGVLTTPIGFGDLWDVKPADRLSEMEFELPLSDADGGFHLAAVAELMQRHLPDDDPLRPYADEVAGVSDERFHGFLTGSIDSVLRVRSDGEARYVVVDYKTNRIQPGDLVAEVFSAEAMAEEMMSSHYPLQALLYSVALHRYLRWRQPGYDPRRHLGPVQYHFVRGMVGPATPSGCGVFSWDVPAALVLGLSDLLAGVGDD
ncbi:UvrD-helicase domain-containing protein [Gordonia sp. (in: high G+C Gram-positive bacteria)]|uniref:UvrD-helicase domain-containing protein n=1 Tax=Gordonia sp. (in: high G+C Gram-positive bacteria) TaxID=84139 RepID=UPI0039E3CBC3